jgi:hypothetical protein
MELHSDFLQPEIHIPPRLSASPIKWEIMSHRILRRTAQVYFTKKCLWKVSNVLHSPGSFSIPQLPKEARDHARNCHRMPKIYLAALRNVETKRSKTAPMSSEISDNHTSSTTLIKKAAIRQQQQKDATGI